MSRAFRALDMVFTVRASHPPTASIIERIYAACATDDDASVTYSVVEREAGGSLSIAMFENAQRLETPNTRALALAYLVWQVSQRAVADSGGTRLLLHAAAAELDQRAVLLSAPSGAGKSTLVAGLAHAGLRYLTDDIAPIVIGTRRVQPYPKPIALAADVLALFPDVAARLDADEDFFAGEVFLSPAMLGADTGRESAVRLVVVPEFVAGAELVVTELTRAATLVQLAEQSFNFAEFGRDAVHALASMLGACHCVHVQYGALGPAVDTITELLSSG
jgi:hypothetical protein